MDWYDWLLFFHVAAAFALVAAMVAFWAITIATARGYHPAAAALGKPAAILVALGSVLTLIFGIWLAIDSDDYQVWDGWIIASIVLWAIGVETGRRAGDVFTRAGEGGPEAPALRQRGLVLHSTSSVAILAVLVLMIFKPGA